MSEHPNKLEVLFNNQKEEKNIYITFSIKCGLAYRYVHFENEQAVEEVNQAAVSVYVNYLSAYIKKKYFKVVKVENKFDCTSVSLKSNLANWKHDVRLLYDTLYNTKIETEIFETELDKTIASFKECYKDNNFKMFYYMIEFSDSGKSFSFNKFIGDLKEMSLEELEKFVSYFIFPGNSVAVITGDMAVMGSFPELKLTENEQRKPVTRFAFKITQPEIKEDRELISNYKLGQEVGCIKFYTWQTDIKLAESFVFLHVLAELLPFKDYRLTVDNTDMAIVYFGATAIYKDTIIEVIENGDIERSRNILAARLDGNNQKFPLKINALWGQMLIQGLDIHDCLELIESYDRDKMLTFYKKADFMITEAFIKNKQNEEVVK